MPRSRELWSYRGFVLEPNDPDDPFVPGSTDYRGEFSREMKRDLQRVAREYYDQLGDKDAIDASQIILDVMRYPSFRQAQISVEEFHDGFREEMMRRIGVALGFLE